MDQLWLQLGAFGALVGVVVSLVVALRTGTLASGRELRDLRQAHKERLAELRADHAAQLGREQTLHDGVVDDLRGQIAAWQASSQVNERALRTALDANELLAQQADRLASGTELTQRLIETMRALAAGKGGP